MKTQYFTISFLLLLTPFYSFSQMARLPIQVNPDGENVIELKANGFAKFSPDGKYIAVNGDEGVDLWDLQTGELYKSFQNSFTNYLGFTRNYIAFKLDFSQDMKKMVIVSGTNLIFIWDFENVDLLHVIEGYPQQLGSTAHSKYPNQMTDVVVSPNGNYVVTKDRGTPKLWEVESGQELSLNTLNLTGKYGLGLDFSMDGRLFAIGKSIWTMNNRELILDFDHGYRESYYSDRDWFESRPITVSDVYFSNDIDSIYTASLEQINFSIDNQYQYQPYISIWDISDGNLINKIKVPSISHFDISINDKYLIDSINTYLFDIENEKVLIDFEDPIYYYPNDPEAEFHPNGNMFLINGPNPSSVYIYNVDDFAQPSNIENYFEYK